MDSVDIDHGHIGLLSMDSVGIVHGYIGCLSMDSVDIDHGPIGYLSTVRLNVCAWTKVTKPMDCLCLWTLPMIT